MMPRTGRKVKSFSYLLWFKFSKNAQKQEIQRRLERYGDQKSGFPGISIQLDMMLANSKTQTVKRREGFRERLFDGLVA